MTEGAGPREAAEAATRQPDPDEFDGSTTELRGEKRHTFCGRFAWVDENASNFRQTRFTDPCEWADVFWERNVDPNAFEVWMDEVKADKLWGRFWGARIPAGPRDVILSY